MTSRELTFKVGRNPKPLIAKMGTVAEGETRWTKFNGGFRREEHTPESLMREVAKGCAFTSVMGDCKGMCCGKWCTADDHKRIPGHCGRPYGYRRNAHFKSAQFIAPDFDTADERSDIAYLLQQPLICRYCSFLYTTLSHKPDAPKARAVFITDAPFTDPDYYRRAKRALMAALPWGDAGIHDPARLLYGTHPQFGRTEYIGGILPLSLVDQLIDQYRVSLETAGERRELPRIPSDRIMGDTPAERYVSAAIQAEADWVARQTEGSGERHRSLLVAALKLESLRLSEWLPSEVRASVDPYAILLPAAETNGYVQKYGLGDATRTITDGMAYASPRPEPMPKGAPAPKVHQAEGYPVAGVRL